MAAKSESARRKSRFASSRPSPRKRSPGYTDTKWAQLRVGDTEQRVRALLGQPLATRWFEQQETWLYSASDDCSNIVGTFVSVRNGIVTLAWRATDSRDQRLHALAAGGSATEMRRELGEPLRICPAFSGEGWRYTRPDGNSNYHYREVLLQAGRVHRITTHVYYD